MAIIHYDVTFTSAPKLTQIKDKLDARMGLKTRMSVEVIEVGHAWPYLGMVRESGTIECDECDESDLEMTVGSTGVRVSCVPSSTHPYFRESAIATLIDLGGIFDAKLDPFVSKKWKDLSADEKKATWRSK
jgi:hypothetical protein